MIPIYEPDILKYKQSALEAVNSGWISNHGKFIGLASSKLVELTGSKHCILMNNGTSATRCLLKALKYKYPSLNLIYVPNNVFAAVWNCVSEEYESTGVKIEVLEVDRETLNMNCDQKYINTLKDNAAVFVVHNMGNIVNVPYLKTIRPDLVFVEDNCEGFLGKYGGVYTGVAALCSSISFYGNKNITTGEGGAFLTNDDALFEYIKTYCNHGMSSTRYIHKVIGTNFRMTNIQAGFLYDQLNDIQSIISRKKIVFENYKELLYPLMSSGKISLLKSADNTEISYWIFALKINREIDYNKTEQFFGERLIQIRPAFYDFREHSIYDFTSDNIQFKTNTIMIPSSPSILYSEQQYIVKIITEYLQ
jgi:perosamine synthetase